MGPGPRPLSRPSAQCLGPGQDGADLARSRPGRGQVRHPSNPPRVRAVWAIVAHGQGEASQSSQGAVKPECCTFYKMILDVIVLLMTLHVISLGRSKPELMKGLWPSAFEHCIKKFDMVCSSRSFGGGR